VEGYEHITAFVDESGNHDLDVAKKGASSLFVCVAVLLRDSDVGRADALLLDLEKRLLNGAPLKSSRVGSNHRLRAKLLRAISDIPFGYYATIVDKARIAKESGLRFQPSFYKRINRMLYETLLRGITSVHIVADRYGSRRFMHSFEKYLETKTLPMLYTVWTHEFRASRSTPLIQVADLIAGSLAWCFAPDKGCGTWRDKFLEILREKELGSEAWPPRIKPIPKELPSTPSEWDLRIRAICRNSAVRFIDRFSGSSEEERQMQVSVLRHMLFLQEYQIGDSPAKHSATLIRHLTSRGFEEITSRKFRQSIIGPLRDQGVIIAGDSNGYRLAMCADDVNRYIRHSSSIVEPMMARLLRARSLLKTGTANRFDMLASEEFTVLRKVLQTFGTVSITHSIAQPPESNDDAGEAD